MPTSLIGGAIGAVGSWFGADAAADAAKESAKMQKDMYNKNSANLQPWMTSGQNALGAYGDAIGLNGNGAQSDYFADWQNDPYYTGIMKAGQEGIQNAALAQGRGYGGNVLNDLNRYSMDVQKGAYNDRLNQLFGVSEAGRGAAGALAGQGTTAAQNAGNFNAQAGYGQGAGYMGAAKGFEGAYNNFSKANPNYIGNALGNYFLPNMGA